MIKHQYFLKRRSHSANKLLNAQCRPGTNDEAVKKCSRNLCFSLVGFGFPCSSKVAANSVVALPIGDDSATTVPSAAA